MQEYDPLLTMSALNMAIVSLHRITSSGDRLILDREYDRIINNLRMGEINPDPELKELYLKIVRVIQNGRLRDDVRAVISQNDSEKKHKSIREIITGNVLKSFSTNPLKWLGKLAMSSASEYFTQEKEAEQNKSNDEEQLRLRRDELDEYDGLQRKLLGSSWTLMHKYQIPDNYRLTQDALKKFSAVMNEPEPSKRHRMMKYLEREFAMYAPYWFYRAKFANESGHNDEAKKYLARFAEVWRPVLRKDPYRAEAMKYRIQSLMSSGVNQDNAAEILECLAEMRANTKLEEWANNIFAGMVYFALGRKDEAVDCVMGNVLFNYENEMSSKVLERMETEELPPRIEPLPETHEPPQEELPEPPTPEPVQENLPEPPEPMSDEDFLKLCRTDDALTIEEAILNGANVNAQSYKGKTALMSAVVFGHPEVAELLIQHGANVNAKDNDGKTALMFAEEGNNREVVSLLRLYGAKKSKPEPPVQKKPPAPKPKPQPISDSDFLELCKSGDAVKIEAAITDGANVNAKSNYGETPLMFAVLNGKANVAEVLLNHGADVNNKYKNGWTVLILAIVYNKVEIAEVFLKHGVDVNAKSDDGKTALMWAEEKNQNEVVRLLRSYGAKSLKPKIQPMNYNNFLKLCKSGDAMRVKEAIHNGANVNAKDDNGITALMLTAMEGQAEVTEILLRHGANLNIKDNDGWTALIFAAMKGQAEVTEILLRHGANLNIKDNDGWTALIFAARWGHIKVVKVLLKHCADVNAKNNIAWTALMYAACEGNIEIAEVLIEHCADTNAKSNNDWTALMFAAIYGRAEVAEILLKHGADVNAHNNNDKTALILAKEKNRSEVVRLLLQYGAKLTKPKLPISDNNFIKLCKSGDAVKVEEAIRNGANVNANPGFWMSLLYGTRTALMFAAEYGYVKIAEVLLTHGADVNAKDNIGWTALTAAAWRNRKEIEQLLLSYGAEY